MDKKKLIKKIAKLETINDQLVAELLYLNKITKELGFQNGLKTLKAAAQELLNDQKKENPDFPNFNDDDE